MAGVGCHRCGFVNDPDANFCSACGADLGSTEEQTDVYVFDPSEDGEPPPADCPIFVVRRGAKAGSRYAVDAPRITLGRHPDSDIFLDDVTVSRRHAEVQVTEGGHMVVDVGSLNGTYINRERIDRAPLHDGDELQVGKFKLVFLEAGRPEAGETFDS